MKNPRGSARKTLTESNNDYAGWSVAMSSDGNLSYWVFFFVMAMDQTQDMFAF
jgi:hypothetical protein